jgi:hypothetical protein
MCTGANYSAVQRKVLAELSIPLDDQVAIDTATGGVIHERKTAVESMSVGGLTVLQMSVNTLDSTVLSQDHQRVSGILGESFLKHFDILLDYEKKSLVLDRTSQLSNSLAGEQIPFSRFGVRDGTRTLDRIVIELKIPAYLKQPLLCVVDNGASSPLLFPEESQGQHLQIFARPSKMTTFSGDRCLAADTSLVIGDSTLHGAEVFSCGNMTRKAADTDCLLPTRLFKQIFISHTNSYLIVNPKTDPHNVQEVADAVLLTR